MSDWRHSATSWKFRPDRDEVSISWNLVPALNAPGRIGENPRLATDLLLATDPVQADQLAQQCRQLNLLRRSIQEKVLEEAEQNLTPTESGILHWSAGAPAGIPVWSVSQPTAWPSAIRRPVIVLALDGDYRNRFRPGTARP